MDGTEPSFRVISCSLSSPPPKARSAPKSTSLTRNAEGSEVQRSRCMWVMADASIGCEVNSTPANTRLEYCFSVLPSITTSCTSAWSQSADQVSTGTSS